MDRSNRLATKRIPALLTQFAVPSIASLILHAFYNVVDRIFIGQGVGSLGLAGVTLCFPIILLLFGVCMLFSSGASSLISIYLGKERRHDAEKVLGSTISVITIIGFVVALCGHLYYKNILALFNIPAEILPYAEGYLKIILSGSPLFLYGFTLTFIIRAEGNPLYATAAIVVGTFVNLILDPIFIFVFSMGTEGAALATIIAEATVALMGLLYMTRKKGVVHIHRKNLALDFQVIKSIMFLGMSTAVMNIAASAQCLFLNHKLIIYGGSIAVAAMGIVFPIASMLRLFTFGMAAGMQPIIGYNYGAGSNQRVKDTFYYACKVNLLAISVFVVLIMVFAENIASVFSKGDRELTLLGAHALRVFLFMFPFAVINILGARYFQAVGKGTKAMAVGVSGQILIFIPLLFILSGTYGLDGIWFSGPLTDFLAFGITGLFITREMKSLS
ncbi:MAG: MATE family efflux transporter [Candidatus Omnitrophica bacterium]|nr:MATE family efflux transporter [Candidatus Omnitrophota bacterium]